LAGADIFIFDAAYAQAGGFHLDSYLVVTWTFICGREIYLCLLVSNDPPAFVTGAVERERERGGGSRYKSPGPGVPEGCSEPRYFEYVCVFLGSIIICR
jgi:hypothetical protein